MKQENFRAVLCCCRKQHPLVRGSLSPLGLDSLNNKHLFLRVLDAEKCKNKAAADLVSGESRLWFIDSCLLTGSFHMAVAVRELSVVSFRRALIPSSRPNHFPKGPFPNIVTLGIRFSKYEFERVGEGQIQTFSN